MIFNRLRHTEARKLFRAILGDGFKIEAAQGVIGALKTNAETQRCVTAVASEVGQDVLVRLGPLHVDEDEFPDGTILMHHETMVLRLYPTREPGVPTELLATMVAAYLEGKS